MKVFCINDFGWCVERNYFLFKREIDVDGPDYGDINTVLREYYSKGILYYELVEWHPEHPDDGFQADCFIPLSEIDETELVNKKEIVEQ